MDQLYNLEAWKVLAAVNDTGSMSHAADSLSMEVSTVSRLVAGLEKALGRDLVNRNRRPVIITDDGRAAVAGVRPMLKQHQAFLAKMLDDSKSMQGLIRLSVAGGLLSTKLMPMLLEFQRLYPKIEFDIHSGRQVAECLAGKIDIASISAPPTETGLVSLPRGRSVFIPVASPEYIRRFGKPMQPEDLRNHAGFVYTGPVRPHTTELVRHGEKRPLEWRSRIQSTDIQMIKRAVVDGLGVAVDLPLLHCYKELESGKLELILNGWHRPPVPAFAVCSNSAWHIRRVRIFMQWWCDLFQREFKQTEEVAERVLGPMCYHYFE
ncbi:MAG: LysR family transcriptional regulator [Duodenibacillus sp.]|nr:LysR family transcriptional regulator [Duodenibacillus sp.]